MSPLPPHACDFYVPIGGPYLVHSRLTHRQTGCSLMTPYAPSSCCSTAALQLTASTASLWDLLYRLHHLALPVPIQAEPHLREAHVSKIQPKSIWMFGEGITRSTSLAGSNGSDINNISFVVRMKLALQCPPPNNRSVFSLSPRTPPLDFLHLD
jgi:hypothetical protein